jgi:hypothetical protein
LRSFIIQPTHGALAPVLLPALLLLLLGAVPSGASGRKMCSMVAFWRLPSPSL